MRSVGARQIPCAGMRGGRCRRAGTTGFIATFLLGQAIATFPVSAQETLPTGGNVVSGSANISAPAAGSLLIDQSSQYGIIEWDGFSVGSGNAVSFQNGTGATLNRVTGSSISAIDGSLTASGSLFLINENGVIIGEDGVVETGGSFIASTLDVADGDFLDGGDTTFAGAADTQVVNLGRIGSLGGDVAMISKTVVNDGRISAPNGTVGLAVGREILLRDAALDDGKFFVRIGDPDSSITEKGHVEAAEVELRANGGNIYALAGNNDGAINATGVATSGGRVFLTAPGGSVTVKKTVRARRKPVPASPKADGGTIFANADFVSIGGLLDVSGDEGGTARVDGRAVHLYGDIQAAGDVGNGGTVAINTDETFLGVAGTTINASGVAGGGSVAVDAGTNFFSSGALLVDSTTGNGGTISVDGETIKFASASLSADGLDGGGTILIGGTREDTSARQIFADGPSSFSATATASAATGGTITFWSTEDTAVGSHLDTTASGGWGFMEVSGHEQIRYGGLAEGETLLLDPKFIIVDDSAGTFVAYAIDDPNNSGAAGAFGVYTAASNGLLLVSDYNDDDAAENAGAVYVFDEQTRQLIGTITGSTAHDQVGVGGLYMLGDSGVAYIRSHVWNETGAVGAGAVTLIDLAAGTFLGTATTAVGAVSASNSITGSTASDVVGSGGVGLLGDSGVAYIRSDVWNNSSAADAGAVTLIDLATGTFLGTGLAAVGSVSASNSIVGSTANDRIGAYGVDLLGDSGVASIRSHIWNNSGAADAGAVTLIDLAAGTFLGTATTAVGAVSASNSITGSTANDNVGKNGVYLLGDSGVAYIRSDFWNNTGAAGAGAVTLIDLSAGTFLGTGLAAVGSVSASNSILGSTADDRIGTYGVSLLGDSGIAFIRSYYWNDTGAADAGAVTLIDLSAGTFLGTSTTAVGAVSASNSIIGSTVNDNIGKGGVNLLGDSGVAYIRSQEWDTTGATNAGAVTLIDLSAGTFLGTGTPAVGAVSASNSITGSTTYDYVGNDGVAVLGDSGIAYIRSYSWNDTGAADTGAVTLIDLSEGTFLGTATTAVGAVSASNSIVGSTAYDRIGYGGINLLGDSGIAYIRSQEWDAAGATNAGAVTLIDLAAGTFLGTATTAVGAVSASNSITGSTANDNVGNDGVAVLGDSGVAYIRSRYWNNTGAADAGAVTLIDLSAGTFLGTATTAVGAVSASNSITSSTTGDYVGIGGVSLLGDSGVAYIRSDVWNNSSAADAGAVTLIDLATGTFLGTGLAAVGSVSASNSITGSTTYDYVGNYGVAVLGDSGVAYIRSRNWDNTGAADAGAVTLIDLAAGTFLGTGTTAVGAVSASNSITGSTNYDYVGDGGVNLLGDSGVAYIHSQNWDNTGATNAGAVTLIDLSAGTFLGTATTAVGAVSATNSITGSTTYDYVGNNGVAVLGDSGVASIRSRYWNNNGATYAGAVTLIDLSAGTFLGTSTTAVGVVSAANSITGSTTFDHVGDAAVSLFGDSGVAYIRSQNWNNTGATDAGAVTLIDLAAGTFLGTGLAAVGSVSASNSIIGSNAYDRIGAHGVYMLGDSGVASIRSQDWDDTGAADAGAVTLIDLAAGTFLGTGTAAVGAVSASNSIVGSTASDSVGNAGVSLLGDSGVAFIRSYEWNNTGAADAGAVTLIDLATGTFLGTSAAAVGAVSASNSIVGTVANQRLGYRVVQSETEGIHYFGGNSTSIVQINTNGLESLPYGYMAGDTIGVSASALADTLSAGTSITLQANSDITVLSDVLVNAGGGTAGSLVLEAGRSITIDAAISTDGGDLTMLANAGTAAGVVDSERDPGAATLDTSSGTIDLGGGSLIAGVANGAGQTNSTAGQITLGNIQTSGSGSLSVIGESGIYVVSGAVVSGDAGISLVADGGVNLAGTVSSTGTGDAIVISGASFVNSAGASALNAVNGRWLVWSGDPSADTRGGLGYDFKQYDATYGVSSVLGTGNGFLYSIASGLTVGLTGTVSKTYNGNSDATVAAANFTFTSGGAIDGDLLVVASTSASYDDENAGTGKNVTANGLSVTATDGSATIYGYTLTASSASGSVGTIDPATLVVTANALSKTYGDADPTLTFQTSGWQLSDSAALLTGVLVRASGETVADGPYAIGQGSLDAGSNYTIAFTGADFTIDPATLVVTADALSKTYGDADPTLTFQTSGWQLSDSAALLTGVLVRASGETVAGGPYAIGQGTLDAGSNYTIDFTGADFTIDPATLVVTADALSKTYGDADPTLTYQTSGWQLSDSDALLTGVLVRASGETVADGPYAIGQGTLDAGLNYTIAFTGADFAIDPATLVVTANALSKTYGDADPTLTYQTSGWQLSDSAALLTGVLVRASGETVADGPYAIGQGSLDAGSNYTIDFTGADFTIDPATLTVTANALSKTYGDADPTLTYQTSGWQLSDSAALLTGVLVRASGETVVDGPYAIGQGTLDAGSNYTIDFTGADFIIDPATLTVTALDFGKDFDGTPYTGGNGVVYAGFVASEDESDLAGTLVYTGTSQGAVDPGSYVITPGGLMSGNYLISFVDGELTIESEPQTSETVVPVLPGPIQLFEPDDPYCTEIVDPEGGLCAFLVENLPDVAMLQ